VIQSVQVAIDSGGGALPSFTIVGGGGPFALEAANPSAPGGGGWPACRRMINRFRTGRHP